MKKILGIIAIGIFMGFNPVVINFSYAGVFDVFKNPLELCMDRVVDVVGEYDVAYAAKVCNKN